MNFGTFIKRLQDVMWQDAGVSGDAQRIEQIVWMLFLKIYDAKETEWEIVEDNYVSIIPEEYRWRNWSIDKKDGKALTGDELTNFVSQLFVTLKDLPVDENTPMRGRIVRDVFLDLNNYMKDGILIRQVVNIFNEIDLTDFKTRHAFNEIYETILKDLQTAGKYGEFYTPRALTEFITKMVNPKVGESVADFACGTGGFLVSALKFMKQDIEDTKKNGIFQKSFFGVEKKPLPYLLCTTNMLLHDINEPNIIRGNSLEKNVRDYEEEDKFDVILMNPPYGGTEKKSVQQNFPQEMRTSETANLFVIEILYRLKKNGRVGIILPDGFLFGTDSSSVAIKKKLLEEFNLHTIIRLPRSVFAPYATITTNLLFFDNTTSTENVWFYRMDIPKGYKAFSKTKPIEEKHLKCVEDWWNNRVEIKDIKEDETLTETWKAKKVGINEIISNDYSLDYCGYPVKEDIIRSPKETVENFINEREKIENEIKNLTNQLNNSLNDETVNINYETSIYDLIQNLANINLSFPNDMKKSILNEAITGKLTKQNENVSSYELVEKAKIQKQEAVKNKKSKNNCKPDKKIELEFAVPKNWTKVCIGEIADITSGGTPSRSNSNYWNGNIPWLKIGDISSKYVDSCSEYITEEGLSNSSAKIFEKGTILYTIFATIGNVGILNFEASTNQAIAGIKLFGDFNIEYIYYVCLALKDVLMKKGRGCAQLNINQEILNNVEIPIPPLEEQKRIVQKLDEILPLLSKSNEVD